MSNQLTLHSLPPTLDAKGLARLLHKSVKTILRNVSRSPHTLPPFIKAGKNTIWFTEVVFNWLAEKSTESIEIKIVIGPSNTIRPPAMLPLGEAMMAASWRTKE